MCSGRVGVASFLLTLIRPCLRSRLLGLMAGMSFDLLFSLILIAMPKITKPKSGRQSDVKPYTTPSTSDIDPSLTIRSKAGNLETTPTKPRTKLPPWTDAERLVLFKIAITKGASAKNFEGVLEGRSAHLCYCQW